MAEFFLSTDFGILLCVFFFGVGVSGRLAAWVRAIHAGLVSLRKRTLRYRLGEIEVEVESLKSMRNDLRTVRHKVFESVQGGDLEGRVKLIEDWLVADSGARLSEIVEEIKKKAKERTEAIKKLN